ncbi:MAG TPA: glycosyltransferase family 39 protein [Planctomycetota bacterium]|nr:glycosyltransferase family 39 protein [Planctomycetota bacterium]
MRRTVLWVAAVVLATFLVRVPTFRLPLDQDGSVFATVATTWADGGLPYRDAWDHKPPLTYLVYRGLFLFGPATGPGVNFTLRVGSALCDAAAAVLLFLLARRFFGFRAGVGAGLVYTVFAGMPILQLEAFQPERLAVLCTVAGVLAAVAYADCRRYSLAALSGLLFGFGLIAKQIVAPVGVLVWAWLTWDAFRAEGRAAVRRVVIHSVLLAVGAVLPWGLCVAYFAAHGAFGEFWECTWRFNLFYAEEHRKGSLLAGAVTAARTMVFDHGFLWLSALGGMAVALARPALRRWGVLLVGWVLVAFLALILPGQFAYYYYVPTVAPLAIAAGVALGGLWRAARTSPAAAVGAALAALALLAPLGLAAKRSHAVLVGHVRPDQTNVVVADVARYVRSKTNEGARIYMRGGRPQVYVLAGRRNICPFLYDFYYGLPPDKAYHYQPHKLEAILEALDRWQPPFIVVTTRGDGPDTEVFGGAYEKLGEYFPEFLKRLGAQYELDRKWPARPVSLMVFRRKEAP